MPEQTPPLSAPDSDLGFWNLVNTSLGRRRPALRAVVIGGLTSLLFGPIVGITLGVLSYASYEVQPTVGRRLLDARRAERQRNGLPDTQVSGRSLFRGMAIGVGLFVAGAVAAVPTFGLGALLMLAGASTLFGVNGMGRVAAAEEAEQRRSAAMTQWRAPDPAAAAPPVRVELRGRGATGPNLSVPTPSNRTPGHDLER